jgi:transcriptional regulator with GAF, ATPase, and Fis domain
MSETIRRQPDSIVPLTGARAPAKLVVVAGPDEGLEIALDGSVDVGTDTDCDMVLTDPTVSGRHAGFAAVAGSIIVKDRGSTNGIFLGETKVVEAEIPLGALLTLGKTLIAVHPRWYMREVQPSSARQFGRLIGESVAMREIFALLERVSPTDVTVLVEGESGTGKEVVARSIHEASHRADGPYVVFDCSAVPPQLAESELFGHVRGAFSGAVSDRAGAFGRADGGTLCLDELGELPLELQPKLLRVLESGEYRSVGSDEVRQVDVRVIAATNRDLHAEARRGNFRTDLLYRLEVVKLRLPPLRQRPEDIPALVAHFLASELPPGDVVAGPNLQRLLSYSWPGNARELRNVLSRAVALARRPDQPTPFSNLVFNLGPVDRAPLTIGIDYPGVSSPMPYKDAKAQLLASFERAYVEALLERHDHNITQAAQAAGVSRKHLYSLIKNATGESLD